jgi:hypothetical protein
MRYFAKSVALISSLLIFNAQAAFGEDDDNASHLQITFLDCANAISNASPSVYVYDDQAAKRIQPHITVSRNSFAFVVRTALAPGFYQISLNEGTCSDSIRIPILRDHDQDILLIGSKFALIRESVGMIAGVLPFNGYTAGIVYRPEDQTDGSGPRSLVEDPARVQGNAYYATGLPSGIARLRIRTSDGVRFLEFKIGRVGLGGRRNQVFSPSLSEIKDALDQQPRIGP